MSWKQNSPARHSDVAGDGPRASFLEGATRFASRLPWWALPLAIFGLTRVVDLVLLLVSGEHQTRMTMRGSDERVVPAPPDPSYPTLTTNWDAQWYWAIARDGYPTHLPESHGEVQRNVWAFYPMFPALAKLLMLATRLPFDIAGPLVALSCAAVGACVLFAIVVRHGGRFTAGVVVLALGFYPAAPVLQAAYSEGTALMLIAAAVWCLDRRKYAWFMVVCVLLGFTRPVSLALALLVTLLWLVRWWRRHHDSFPPKERIVLAAAATEAAATFALWPLACALVLGRWDGYTATQRAWLPHAANGLKTWVWALLGGATPVAAFVTGLAVALLLVLVLRHGARAWGAPLRLWPLAYAAFLLLTVRPASSSLRYPLLMMVPFWPFPELTASRRPRWLRWGIVVLVITFGIVFQLWWLRWFYVPGKLARGYA